MSDNQYLRTFECDCGNSFEADYTDCEFDRICEGMDDLCDCAGRVYYCECPKCGKDAEYETG